MFSSIRMFFIFVLSLLLTTSLTSGRKDPGEYWGEIMKSQPMPEAIKGFLNQHLHEANEIKSKNYVKVEDMSVNRDFDPIPNLSVYHDEAILKIEDKSFAKDFDPIPNISVYHDGVSLKEGDKSFTKDFDPIPNISVYHDDVTTKEMRFQIEDHKSNGLN